MSRLYSPQVVKDKILTNISAAIREIHRLAVVDDDNDDEQTSRTISNDHWQVHCLLEHLDFALLYGLKFVQDGFYKFVTEFSPKLLLTDIESLLNIETDIGRGRAWLFAALNDNLTESYMKCFQENKKLVRQFYTTDSIVFDTQRLIALGTLCSGLENIHFDLKIDCVYFDRGCWPAYLQKDLNDAEKLSLPGVRNDVPTFSSYLTRYDVHHIPSSPAILKSSTVPSKRVRLPKRSTRSSSNASPIVSSSLTPDVLPTNLSRSSSVSFDNPSIDGVSSNDDTQISNFIPITTDSPVPIATSPLPTGFSSSLSELDPMLNSRPRTPSPIPSPIVDEQIITETSDEQIMTNSVDDKSFLTDTIENQPLIDETPPVITENPPTILESLPTIVESLPSINETESSINEKRISTSVDDSINTSDKMEPSLSISSNNELHDSSFEQKNDDIFPMIEEDQLDILADANIQLQFTLEVYEVPNDEQLIKLFPTTLGINNGNAEVVFLLVTTVNVYLLRQVNETNGLSRIDKIETIRLEQIDYIEIGPNEQFLRIITVKHTKLRSLTTGCVALTRDICDSIRKAAKIRRISEPQVLPATMQEISIKKMLAQDLKKSSVHEVKLIDYHYTFWEEPQMSGRKLRKEGYLQAKLLESGLAMRRLSVATLKTNKHGFESWHDAYVTLRVDRLNIYAHKSDMNPALSYTLLDEDCQGCRRNRNSDKPNVIEIMFANDVTLVLSAKSKTEQDEWLNAIMKGLSQGRMATKDEENTANTVPCSVMLTDEKIYVCHDEQDNALIRQLDSIKLEYVARLFVDPQYQYYCVISIEHGNQGSKSWIFYFLYAKEMIQFIKALQKALSDTYQIPFDINPLTDVAFQRECERTSKQLLRLYCPSTITP